MAALVAVGEADAFRAEAGKRIPPVMAALVAAMTAGEADTFSC